jgi:hypothetical protein
VPSTNLGRFLISFIGVLRRDEIVREIFAAPRRRLDHEVSRLSNNLHALTMHCRLLDAAQQQYQIALWRCRKLFALAVTVSLAAVAGSYSLISWGSAAAVTSHDAKTIARDGPTPTLSPKSADVATADQAPGSGPATSSANCTLTGPDGKLAEASQKVMDKVHAIKDKVNEHKAEYVDKVFNSAEAIHDALHSPEARAKMKVASKSMISRLIWRIWPAANDEDISVQQPMSAWAYFGYVFTGCSIVCGGALVYNQYYLTAYIKDLLTENSFQRLFEKVYCVEIAERDESVVATWTKVIAKLKSRFAHIDFELLPQITNEELSKLRKIEDSDIARLRLRAMRLVTDSTLGDVDSFRNANSFRTAVISSSNDIDGISRNRANNDSACVGTPAHVNAEECYPIVSASTSPIAVIEAQGVVADVASTLLQSADSAASTVHHGNEPDPDDQKSSLREES